MVPKFQYGGQIPIWWPNSNMVAKFQYGGQIPIWWPNSNMVAKFQYGGQIPIWWPNSNMVAKFQYGGQLDNFQNRTKCVIRYFVLIAWLTLHTKLKRQRKHHNYLVDVASLTPSFHFLDNSDNYIRIRIIRHYMNLCFMFYPEN